MDVRKNRAQNKSYEILSFTLLKN